MNQFIKKLFIFCFVIQSQHAFSQKFYYFIGTGTSSSPGDASDLGNWNSSKSASYTSLPDTLNGNPNDFFNSLDTFDLNGKYIDLKNCSIADITFDNTSTSTGYIVNSGKLTILSSGLPTFGISGSGSINYDFSSSGSTVEYNATNGTSYLGNWTHANVILSATDCNSSGNFIVNGNLLLSDASTGNPITLTINPPDKLILGASSTVSENNTGISTFLVYGDITDNRTTKSYPNQFTVNTSGLTFTGFTFEKLRINSNCTLAGNTKITKSLYIGANTSSSLGQVLLTIAPNATIEFSGTSLTMTSFSTANRSRINWAVPSSPNVYGTLILNPSSTLTLLSTQFGTSTTTTASPVNIEIAGGTVALGTSLTISESLKISNGTLSIVNYTLTLPKLFILSNSVTTNSWCTRTSGKINMTGVNSKLIINQTGISGTHIANLFTSNQLNRLEINFSGTSGGTYVIPENLQINTELIISNPNNFLDISGYSITINGTITNTNGSSGGKIIGSSTSSLVCGASGTLYFNQSGTNNYLKNFTINNSKSASIGNTLNIAGGTNYGTVIVDTLATCSTGNNLVLKSDANGSARIGKSSGKIVGEYTVEQYIPADRDYRFISSPVVDGTALQLRDNKGSTSGRGIQITGNNPSASTGNDFDASTLNNPSAYYYAQDSAGDVTTISKIAGSTDDPGWRPFWNGNTFKLINGKGYRVFVRGDRSINLNQSGQSPNTTTIWTKGTYPGYSVNIPVQNSGRSKTNNGINLIGNPYPSVIDWNLIQKSNIDSGYMVYNNSNQSYVGWNGVTGSAGQYISAYQGFLVKCTNSSGSGSITVHERTKTVQTGGSFFQRKLTNHLKITMTYDSSYNSDTYLHFREDAKNTYDGNDIQQMLNNGTNVATLDDAGMPYNINSMGTLDSFKSIPLSVEGTPAADLKLSFYDVASFSTHKLELIDNYLKKSTPIIEAMDYAFSITNDSWSYKNGRFFINLTKQETASNKIVQTEKLGILHPNPVKDKINITLEKNATNGKYQIVNSVGQEIMSGDIVGKSKTIDAKNLSTGIYYLNILSNGTTQNIKFIK